MIDLGDIMQLKTCIDGLFWFWFFYSNIFPPSFFFGLLRHSVAHRKQPAANVEVNQHICWFCDEGVISISLDAYSFIKVRSSPCDDTFQDTAFSRRALEGSPHRKGGLEEEALANRNRKKEAHWPLLIRAVIRIR